ncbi:MAG TPA: NADH-quinone oxidoreductase subunit H, partial [Gemmatimonadaceae bacterium]
LFGMNVVLLVVLFVVLDRGRMVSPAYARLGPAAVARLRAQSAPAAPPAGTGTGAGTGGR